MNRVDNDAPKVAMTEPVSRLLEDGRDDPKDFLDRNRDIGIGEAFEARGWNVDEFGDYTKPSDLNDCIWSVQIADGGRRAYCSVLRPVQDVDDNGNLTCSTQRIDLPGYVALYGMHQFALVGRIERKLKDETNLLRLRWEEDKPDFRWT